MADNSIHPIPTDNTSGSQMVSRQEDRLILQSLTLPHGVEASSLTTATVSGYDTMKGSAAPSARPSWSDAYSASMRTLVEATKGQPPEVLHAADYVLEQVAKLTSYDEQKIIGARYQLAQDLKDGSFAHKVEAARGAVEIFVHQQTLSLDR